MSILGGRLTVLNLENMLEYVKFIYKPHLPFFMTYTIKAKGMLSAGCLHTE